ncbi:SMI1/KNR4 family protein [Mariniblastus sp.]|nr:SMI1/KNR4 family protein [Mariniblastus sp.]
MTIRRFLLDDGSTRKYWNVSLKGKAQTVEYARVGSASNSKTKTFDSPSDAKAATRKLIGSKLSSGYVELFPESVKFKPSRGVKGAATTRVRQLEKQIGAKLPSDYVQFLKSSNGCCPDQGYLSIPGHPYIDNVFVNTFYGLHSSVKQGFSIEWAIETQSPVLPKGHLPIARGGDIFTMCLKKAKFGCIYFWDHECESLEENEKYSVKDGVLLSTDFTELLGRLSIFEGEDESEE